LYYFIILNYLVCDSVLLSQTEMSDQHILLTRPHALSDIRACPQLGHLAQDMRPTGERYAASATPLSGTVYKRVAE